MPTSRRRVDRLAAGLERELGLRRGDRVAWLGLNHPDLLALLFACARLGAILVPLNWRLAAPELRAILADAEPRALIAEAGFRAPVEEIRASLPGCRLIARDFAAAGWASLAELLEQRGRGGCGGSAGRCRPDRLHLGHHRAAQGGGAEPGRACSGTRSTAPTCTTSPAPITC